MPLVYWFSVSSHLYYKYVVLNNNMASYSLISYTSICFYISSIFFLLCHLLCKCATVIIVQKLLANKVIRSTLGALKQRIKSQLITGYFFHKEQSVANAKGGEERTIVFNELKVRCLKQFM